MYTKRDIREEHVNIIKTYYHPGVQMTLNR